MDGWASCFALMSIWPSGRVVMSFESVIGMAVWVHNSGLMNASERLELIRARLGRKVETVAKPAGVHAAASGTIRPKRVRVPRGTKGYFTSPAFAPVRDVRVRNGQSLEVQGKERVMGARQRHGKHWLTRVAEKWAKRHGKSPHEAEQVSPKNKASYPNSKEVREIHNNQSRCCGQAIGDGH